MPVATSPTIFGGVLISNRRPDSQWSNKALLEETAEGAEQPAKPELFLSVATRENKFKSGRSLILDEEPLFDDGGRRFLGLQFQLFQQVVGGALLVVQEGLDQAPLLFGEGRSFGAGEKSDELPQLKSLF